MHQLQRSCDPAGVCATVQTADQSAYIGELLQLLHTLPSKSIVIVHLVLVCFVYTILDRR